MRPSQRPSQMVRLNLWLGGTNIAVGVTWLVTGLLGAFRTAWLPLVVGPLFLATGVINCTGAIVRRRADRKQDGGHPDQR